MNENAKILADIEKSLDNIIESKEIASEHRGSAKMLLVGLYFGTHDIDQIAKITQLPRDSFVRPRAKRLRENSIWVNGKTIYEFNHETHPAEASIEFFLHLLCAEGLIRRVRDVEPAFPV